MADLRYCFEQSLVPEWWGRVPAEVHGLCS